LITPLKFGLLVNPVAGIGGSVALKGSDGAEIQARARQHGGSPRGAARTRRALGALGSAAQAVRWVTWGGEMGEDLLVEAGLSCQLLGAPGDPSGPVDTRLAASAMLAEGVDLIVFSGGDGTARDLQQAVGCRIPVLGIPAGVKMHSGVFTATPERAGTLLARLIDGGLVSSVARQVRDLDEVALRAGEIRPRFFGELRVPETGGYLQHTKEGGRENESLAITEISADVVERIASIDEAVVLGPGSTVAEIKRSLGFEGTVLGFDVWRQDAVIALDVDARWLLDRLDRAVVVLSFTRAQGALLGRGNQQLSPAFLRRIGREALWVIGTRTKLSTLEGRPLLIDTDDPDLDQMWSGLVEITAGYEDRLFYRVSADG